MLCKIQATVGGILNKAKFKKCATDGPIAAIDAAVSLFRT